MPIFPFQIGYYITAEGKAPFKTWLEGLRDVAGRAKIRVRLDRTRLGGLGDNRPVGEGVHEMRVDYGPGYRIYFAVEARRLLVLLLGGDKSSQQRDIATAKKYWRDHQERKKYD